MVKPAQTVLPRWRGFNLLEMFTTKSDGKWREDDFRWISDWGFDFVRLPMCYRLWTKGDDPFSLQEKWLERIDRAVDLGRANDLHVNLNFHRAPGYSVNQEVKEPFNLWKDGRAVRAFCFHWSALARRYQGIPSRDLSFNLVNEPPALSDGMSRADHERVIVDAVAAIRAVDEKRLIIIDGLRWGNDPVPELADVGICQSCRAYAPFGLTHYRAGWVQSEGWPEPTYPDSGRPGDAWDRAGLEAHYETWADLARSGVGVHCGEGGAFKHTPHDVVLRWLRDVIEILSGHGIGFALWNFRGPFGILDSDRADVDYEDWHGHKFDRKMLELLTEF